MATHFYDRTRVSPRNPKLKPQLEFTVQAANHCTEFITWLTGLK